MTKTLKTTVYPYLVNKIEIYCTPFYDRKELHPILKEYQKLQGVTGLCDLAGYILWAERRNLHYYQIRETLLHDIDERAEEIFLPKTRGFFELINKNDFK